MTEPNNPLFEDEKEFLERKKLEYERALRGDVEEIKEQTIHVGKVALVGVGVVSGVWLLIKAFSGGKAKKKHKKHKRKHDFDDYAGFDSYAGYEDDNDDHDQELDSLATAYNSPEYAYDHADRYENEDGFYQEGSNADYFDNQDEDGTADDNGLSDYPDFPAHSSTQHGADADLGGEADTDITYGSHLDVYHTDEDHGYDEEAADKEEKDDLEVPVSDEQSVPAHSFASANSYQARPYDDSRRLPESNSFAEDDDKDNDAADKKAPTTDAEAPESKKSWVIPTIMAFAKSETGKVLLAQAGAMAMGFITSKVKDILPGDAAKTGKNADLAHSSALAGDLPAAWPATTAAQNVSAAAQHDDTPTT